MSRMVQVSCDADKRPPPCFAPTPLCAALLLTLPSSEGVAVDAVAVVLALKSGAPAFELTEAACFEELDALFNAGLVDMHTREAGDVRWSRSPAGDALPVVRARYPRDGEEER